LCTHVYLSRWNKFFRFKRAGPLNLKKYQWFNVKWRLGKWGHFGTLVILSGLIPLKEQCHEIFRVRFFSSNTFSWSQ
jgi:hypothetical protein